MTDSSVKQGRASEPSILVSVIVPTTHGLDQIEAPILSALDQSYACIEVVIADDGSDPPSELPTRISADDRVKVVRLPVRSGAAAARNAAIAASDGELIAFLDDDDLWTEEHLEAVVPMFSDSDVGIVQAGYLGEVEGRVVLKAPPPPEQSVHIGILKEPVLFTSAVVVHRRVLRDVGLFDPALLRHQDWDLWIRILAKWGYRAVPRLTVRRRIHDIAISPRERLSYHLEIGRRIRPYVAALPFRSRVTIKLWHARTFLVRVIHIGWVRVLDEHSWNRLRLIRRRYSRLLARLRWQDALRGRY